MAAPQLARSRPPGADALGAWLSYALEPSWLSRPGSNIGGHGARVVRPANVADSTGLPHNAQAIDEDGSGFISEVELTEALMQASGLVDGVSRSEVSKLSHVSKYGSK